MSNLYYLYMVFFLASVETGRAARNAIAQRDMKTISVDHHARVATESDHIRGKMDVGQEITLMTFNVEEYMEGFNLFYDKDFKGGTGFTDEEKRDLKEHVLQKIGEVKGVIAGRQPDVVCLQEHSLGAEGVVNHQEILTNLVPPEYTVAVIAPTGEEEAWFSGLANVVLYKKDEFKRIAMPGSKDRIRLTLTDQNKIIPGSGDKMYTPRSAACALMQKVTGATPFWVCSTHLFGGRFEGPNWKAEVDAQKNEKALQMKRITDFLQAQDIPSAIIAGDFNAMDEGQIEGDFKDGSMAYFTARLGGVEKDYNEFAAWSRQVHRELEQAQFTKAWRKSDATPDMKTSKYSGLLDFVYITKDIPQIDKPEIIQTMEPFVKPAITDHNAVVVKLEMV